MSASIVFLPIVLLCVAFSAWAFWFGVSRGRVQVLDWFDADRRTWPVLYFIGMSFWGVVLVGLLWLATGLAGDIWGAKLS